MKLGEGQELPDPASNGATEVSDILDRPNGPTRSSSSAARPSFKWILSWRPSLEASGEYVALDEVSYKPASGWTYNARDEFSNISDLKSQELAKASVLSFLPNHRARLGGFANSRIRGGASLVVTINSFSLIGNACKSRS